jgi:antitoxin YefM
MAITASQAREQLFPLIEQVNLDSTPVVITSKKGNAVLISESEWESILESMALLTNPNNRKWILEGIEQANRGQTTPITGSLVDYTKKTPVKKAAAKKVSAKKPAKKVAAKKVAPTKKKQTSR